MAYLVVVVLLNVIFSIGCFELILKIQNSLKSVRLVSVIRKSILFVFLGFMFLLFKSVGMDFVGVNRIWQGNGVLIYLLCMLFYLFGFFFPRQNYFNKETGEWVAGYRKRN